MHFAPPFSFSGSVQQTNVASGERLSLGWWQTDAGDADADVMADETDDVMANGSSIIVQPQADDHCGSKMADERSIWGQ